MKAVWFGERSIMAPAPITECVAITARWTTSLSCSLQAGTASRSSSLRRLTSHGFRRLAGAARRFQGRAETHATVTRGFDLSSPLQWPAASLLRGQTSTPQSKRLLHRPGANPPDVSSKIKLSMSLACRTAVPRFARSAAFQRRIRVRS